MEAPHVSTGHIEEHEATINRPVQVHPEIVPVDEKNRAPMDQCGWYV